MTPEEFENLCNAMREFPQLFYDIYLDPSFIRKPNDGVDADGLGVVRSEVLSISDGTLVDAFIQENTDDDDFLSWTELQDLRNSGSARLANLNPELKPFYDLREIFAALIKLKHNGKGFVAIWSPEETNAGVLTTLRSALGLPVAAEVTLDSTLQRLRLIAVENSQHLDYLRPFIAEAVKDNYGIISQYSAFVQERIETNFTLQQQRLQTMPKQTKLETKLEDELRKHILKLTLKIDSIMSQELQEVLNEYKTLLSLRQHTTLLIRMLEEINDLSAMEQAFHARQQFNVDSVENIRYFIYKNITAQMGALAATKLSMPFNTDTDAVQILAKMRHELIATTQAIYDEIGKNVIKRAETRGAINKQQLPAILDVISAKVNENYSEIAEEIFNKFRMIFYGVMNLNKNWPLLRILINNMQLKLASTDVTLFESVKMMDGYIDFNSNPFDKGVLPELLWVFNYVQKQMATEAQHALAYKFARYCIPVQSGKHVTISLVNKFKGDSAEAQQNRITYLVLEMIERNVVPNNNLEKIAPAIELYHWLKSEAAKGAKRSRASEQPEIKAAILNQLEAGNITLDSLIKMLELSVEDRMDIFQARYHKLEAAPRIGFRP